MSFSIGSWVCSSDCAEANDCGGSFKECERCGESFCQMHLDENWLCAECAKEVQRELEEEEDEEEGGEE